MSRDTAEQIQKNVRRHIGVSFASAVAVLALVLLNGLPASVVVGAALVVVVVVAAVSLHVFSERPVIQALMGFTVFFVFMMMWLMHEAYHDEIEGTQRGTYDAPGAVHTADPH